MNEGNTVLPEQDAAEISLLDLALILAENLRILILAPLLAGLVALGAGFLMTPTFTATSRPNDSSRAKNTVPNPPTPSPESCR